MINLKIGNEIYVNSNPTDSFIIEYKVMFGDADGYKKSALGPFKSNANNINYIEEILRVFKEAEKSERDEYEEIEGYDIWFGGEILDGMNEDDPRFEFADDWPNDPFTDYSVPGRLEEYKIFYFDNNGRKFNVEFTLD